MSKSLIGIIGSGVILASFVVSLVIFFEVKAAWFSTTVIVNLFDFIKVAAFKIPFAFQVDQLSSLFLLIITGVGFLNSFIFYSLHARRRTATFCTVFRLPESVCFFNVVIGVGRQLCNHVYWLGRCRTLFLLIDWLLV